MPRNTSLFLTHQVNEKRFENYKSFSGAIDVKKKII
jgi:hypothetical protein